MSAQRVVNRLSTASAYGTEFPKRLREPSPLAGRICAARQLAYRALAVEPVVIGVARSFITARVQEIWQETRRMPSFSTRRISCIEPRSSATCSSTLKLVTPSNEASSNGSLTGSCRATTSRLLLVDRGVLPESRINHVGGDVARNYPEPYAWRVGRRYGPCPQSSIHLLRRTTGLHPGRRRATPPG